MSINAYTLSHTYKTSGLWSRGVLTTCIQKVAGAEVNGFWLADHRKHATRKQDVKVRLSLVLASPSRWRASMKDTSCAIVHSASAAMRSSTPQNGVSRRTEVTRLAVPLGRRRDLCSEVCMCRPPSLSVVYPSIKYLRPDPATPPTRGGKMKKTFHACVVAPINCAWINQTNRQGAGLWGQQKPCTAISAKSS